MIDKTNLPNKMVQAGFTPFQAKMLIDLFGGVDADPVGADLSKLGVADASDLKSAIHLANATKDRLNEVIGALRGDD